MAADFVLRFIGALIVLILGIGFTGLLWHALRGYKTGRIEIFETGWFATKRTNPGSYWFWMSFWTIGGIGGVVITGIGVIAIKQTYLP